MLTLWVLAAGCGTPRHAPGLVRLRDIDHGLHAYWSDGEVRIADMKHPLGKAAFDEACEQFSGRWWRGCDSGDFLIPKPGAVVPMAPGAPDPLVIHGVWLVMAPASQFETPRTLRRPLPPACGPWHAARGMRIAFVGHATPVDTFSNCRDEYMVVIDPDTGRTTAFWSSFVCYDFGDW